MELKPAPLSFDPFSEALLHTLEHGYDNVLLTGKAGTGKSTLVRQFLSKTQKKVIVLASTGVAAIQIGGQTIHSFFGFPPRKMRPSDPECGPWKDFHPTGKLVKQLDALIIDEVSMVRPDLLDAISEKLKNHLKSDLPFGGLQMILVGDMFQLAPVSKEEDDDWIPGLPPLKSYKSPYFFSADAFKEGGFRLVELEVIYRQSDELFIDLLQHIRMGYTPALILDRLRSRHRPDAEEGILLTTTNAIADAENNKRLAELQTPMHDFEAEFSGKFNPGQMPAEVRLRLKKGARVMTLVNDAAERRWSNGSLGTVMEIDTFQDGSKGILVRFDAGNTAYIDPFVWENASYSLDRDNGIKRNVNGTGMQYPLRLAWAVTIHKSQGLTFDTVRIHLGRGAFAGGQLYVALSRCKTLEGISLLSEVHPNDAFTDPMIHTFYQWFCARRVQSPPQPMISMPRRPAKPTSRAKVEVKAERKATVSDPEKEKARVQKNVEKGKAPREGLKWSAPEEQLIKQLFVERQSLHAIASEVGRSASAVGGRLKKMDLLYAFSIKEGYVVTMKGSVEDLPSIPSPTREEWSTQDRLLLLNAWKQGASAEDLCIQFESGILHLVSQLVQAGALDSADKLELGPLICERR